MPISISEIAVHMAVGDGAAPAEATGNPGETKPMTPEVIEDIVRRCTEQVLTALRMEKER